MMRRPFAHIRRIDLPGEGGLTVIEAGPVDRYLSQALQRHAPDFLPQMEQRRPGGRVSHRFWLPGGGYDRNLRSARDVHEKIRYLHGNPLRRGLVERLEDWPWSSRHAHETGEGSPIAVDVESIRILQM